MSDLCVECVLEKFVDSENCGGAAILRKQMN